MELFKSAEYTNSTLEEINERFMELSIPNVIILSAYLIFGILGNSVVITVYLRKMGSTYDNKFFIPCLAIGDIFACIVNGVSAVLLHIFHFNFNNVWPCKVIWFTMTWSACGASLILVYIAFHRYMKICRPTSKWVLTNRKELTVLFLYISSVIISSPLLYTSGVTTLEIETMNQTNSTIYICERIDRNLRRGWQFDIVLTYTVIEALIVTTIASTLTLLYTKVGFMLFKHFKHMLKKKSTKVKENICTISKKESAKEGIANDTSFDIDSTSNMMSDKSTTKSSNKTQRRITKKKKSFHKKHNYTYIFIAISAICIATYTPRLLLMILETVDEDFWFGFYDNKIILTVLKILNRLYIVNNIANPFLYAVFDEAFQTQLISFIKCRH